jgi:hypothetical protein
VILELILESVDEEAVFDERSDYPVGTIARLSTWMSDYTNLLRSRLSACGWAKDYRKNRSGGIQDRNALFYLERLLGTCPALMPLKRRLEVFAAATEPLTEFDLETVRLTFEVIRDGMSEPALPDPGAGASSFVSEQSFAAFMNESRKFDPAPERAVLVADVYNIMSMARALESAETNPDDPDFEHRVDLRRQAVISRITEAIDSALAGFEGAKLRVVSDTFIFSFRSPDDLVSAARAIQAAITQYINTVDRVQFAPYSLLRMGADWYPHASDDATQTSAFVVAWNLCEGNRLSPGELLVSQELHDELSEQLKLDFEDFERTPVNYGKDLRRRGAKVARLGVRPAC